MPDADLKTQTGHDLPPTAVGRDMPESPMYRPAAPPEAERRRSELRQALRLPKTLSSIFRIVREDFECRALDEYLWSFWGFHHQPADLHYRARPWQKAILRSIEPQDVVRIEVWELALLLNIAMEDEEPILEYTHQSGEGFRFLLPTLGRYMGKNEEQARYAAEHGLEWCEGAWCAEERRHSNTLARIIERLMKMPPPRDNPNRPIVVTADEEDALRHLLSRQTTEWNASSSYVVMAAHATGELHKLIRNLERDEVKHLCIMSAADAYLMGPRPWGRFLALVRTGLGNFLRQKQSRSGGDVFGTNPVTAMEGIAAHLLTEFYLRRWLRTVPLRTLTLIFETPSSLPEFPETGIAPERQIAIREASGRSRQRRLGFDRWEPSRKRRALEQRQFEAENEGAVERLIEEELDGFHGAELAGCPREKQIRRRIRQLTGKNSKQLRVCLLARLRDYQIRNNGHVLARIPTTGSRQPSNIE